MTPTLSPNHVRVALINSRAARNPIKVASTAAIIGAPIPAPWEKASIALLASLYAKREKINDIKALSGNVDR